MVDQLKTTASTEEFSQPGSTNIELHKLRSVGNVLALPRGEIVDDGHLPPPREITIGHMRSDESRSTGHQD